MLQVFHAKWHGRLPKGESSEGCGVVVERRGSSFIPRRSEDQQKIEMLKEALKQQDKAMRQRDDFYASAFAQQ
jgi:hypothetical protein